MSSPKVSVVMPVYNTDSAILKESIDSIINQSFADFEFLIVNDSPDNIEIDRTISMYNDPRIKYFKNKKNMGLEYSTNFLIRKANGSYIAIFDHDDISLDERLEKESDYLDQNPQIGMVSSQFSVFGQEEWVSDNPINSEDIKKRLSEVNCVSHTAMMVRKSILTKYRLNYEKEFFPAASYRMITQIALVTEVHNLPDVLVRYRMDGNNTSIKYSQQRVVSRERIRLEYAENLKLLKVKQEYSFDSIDIIDNPPNINSKRYYKALRGDECFFVKSDDHSFKKEFEISKILFEKDNSSFIEPIGFSEYGDTNYLIMRWSDGVGLDEYLKNNKLSIDVKEGLVDNLCRIFEDLRVSKIVHRDIIPRNIFVAGEHIQLLDFHFAVKYDQYEEPSYVKSDIGALNKLGESFAVGSYRWDDAYSIVRIAEYILGEKSALENEMVRKVADKIGEREISPSVDIFDLTLKDKYSTIMDLQKQISVNDDMAKNYRNKINKMSHSIESLKDSVREREDSLRRIINSRSYRVSRLLARPFSIVIKMIQRGTNEK